MWLSYNPSIDSYSVYKKKTNTNISRYRHRHLLKDSTNFSGEISQNTVEPRYNESLGHVFHTLYEGIVKWVFSVGVDKSRLLYSFVISRFRHKFVISRFRHKFVISWFHHILTNCMVHKPTILLSKAQSYRTMRLMKRLGGESLKCLNWKHESPQRKHHSWITRNLSLASMAHFVHFENHRSKLIKHLTTEMRKLWPVERIQCKVHPQIVDSSARKWMSKFDVLFSWDDSWK